MITLGISAYYHDSAAAVVRDGEIIAAVQEERFTRKKHDRNWPRAAIDYCLGRVESPPDLVAFYEDPNEKLERVIQTALRHQDNADYGSTAIVSVLRQSAELNQKLVGLIHDGSRRVYVKHHVSHAASAFFPSPFEEAAILVVDGVGEWSTASIFRAHGREIELLKEIRYPSSVGLLYSAFTAYCGFRVNSGEYKLMGLAPYGSPKYANDILDQLIDLKRDGSFELNMAYFGFTREARMTSGRFTELFGKPRHPSAPITQHYADMAASIQHVLNTVMIRLAQHATTICESSNLCLAGGVALNCVANSLIAARPSVNNIWAQPAAGDAGGALGSALYADVRMNQSRQRRASQKGTFLGPEFTDSEIEESLRRHHCVFEYYQDRKRFHQEIVRELTQHAVVARFHGRMEFGPRSLGARSILADPRSRQAHLHINREIKFREPWRPFAPSILEDHYDQWFRSPQRCPYMMFVAHLQDDRTNDQNPVVNQSSDLVQRLASIQASSPVPAVTHYDYSSRVQCVRDSQNPDFYQLLSTFLEETGCPLLLNTSFNVRGEPIVCTPEDAIHCFFNTGLDVLAIGNYVVRKKDQAAEKRELKGQRKYEPD